MVKCYTSTNSVVIFNYLVKSCYYLYNRIGTCATNFTDSDTTKKCWYWPNTDTDTRIGVALCEILCKCRFRYRIGGYYPRCKSSGKWWTFSFSRNFPVLEIHNPNNVFRLLSTIFFVGAASQGKRDHTRLHDQDFTSPHHINTTLTQWVPSPYGYRDLVILCL